MPDEKTPSTRRVRKNTGSGKYAETIPSVALLATPAPHLGIISTAMLAPPPSRQPMATMVAATAPQGTGAHAFTSDGASAVLSMHRLLLKVISAKDLPPSPVGMRRSVVAVARLLDAQGGRLLPDAPLDARTGPPNHFSTIKDTAPVWNVEMVADLGGSGLPKGSVLSLELFDEAHSPAERLGRAYLPAEQLLSLCMSEDERTLELEPTAGSLSVRSAQGTLRLRLAYVDLREGMRQLGAAKAAASELAKREALLSKQTAAARVSPPLALAPREARPASLAPRRTPAAQRVCRPRSSWSPRRTSARSRWRSAIGSPARWGARWSRARASERSRACARCLRTLLRCSRR